MASPRVARFVTEVAPPQVVCIMRKRTKKVLDTIVEEERDASVNETPSLSSRSFFVVVIVVVIIVSSSSCSSFFYSSS
uniref:Transmembrane protein n=1 Tax=Nelumbo nucifera TaxID=4432 RepID=A0A822YN08_NELNU|nr:TPA_asm: hypothetical protein HUJ06_012763 [Nelumbo nucifera]